MSLESSLDGLVLSPKLLKYIYIYILFCCAINVFGKYISSGIPQIPISPCHTLHNREIWGICKRYVGEWYTCRIVPKVWEHVPIGHVNSPLSPNQTQVLEVAYYHAL